MEITEVRIFLRERNEGKLRAYATITFDDSFVVRDLKVIDGKKGLFVAMPSRKLRISCSECGHRNVVRSKYCNQCGKNIEERVSSGDDRPDADAEHRDIAHPITTEFRDYVQKKVLERYEAEKKGSSAE